MNQPQSQTQPRLGLALGGGGSRALCSLGVLEALEDAGIPIHAVTGSSMGGIVAALYAHHHDASKVCQIAQSYFQKSKRFGKDRKPTRNDGLDRRPGLGAWFKKLLRTFFLANTLTLRKSILRANVIFHAVDELFPEVLIEDLPVPFATVALNLTQARLQTFTSGPLRKSIKVGANIGVVFRPVHMDGEDFIDAAPVSCVPVHACHRLGADRVLAVDIRNRPPEHFPIQNGFDVIMRMESIQSMILNDTEVARADLVITPETGDVFWGDFTNLDPIIEAGRESVRQTLPAIRALLAPEG